LVPGSGGKDSFYAAHKLKYQYGMTPLTVTWAPHIYTVWGRDNFEAWIAAGFDNYLFTPNGRVHRLLTRLALETVFHPFQPFIMGQMYFPPKMAAKMDIPLVFYGENPTEYGNDTDENPSAAKDLSYFTSDDRDGLYVAGVSVHDLKDEFGMTEADLSPFLPATPGEIEGKRINVQYLGHYLPWHPQNCYYYAVENGGFKAAPERSAGTYSKYSSIDDKIDDLHYFTTYIKFGIGRATYDSAQEVRNGDITREEAAALVQRYDGEYSDRFEEENFAFLSLPEKDFPVASKMFEHPVMDREYFDQLTDKFRSPHLWKFEGDQWRLRKSVLDE
jgi:N-acetyl sugar amidotransferase